MFKRLSLVLLAVALPVHAATLIANSYGAKGDGVADDTKSIQKALDAAAGKHDTVTLNAGVYRIGSIFVKSGSRLDLSKGVSLRGIKYHVNIWTNTAGLIADTKDLKLSDIHLVVADGKTLKSEDNSGLQGLDAVSYTVGPKTHPGNVQIPD